MHWLIVHSLKAVQVSTLVFIVAIKCDFYSLNCFPQNVMSSDRHCFECYGYVNNMKCHVQ